MDAGTLDAEKIAAYAEQNCATASLAECAARFCCHPNSITRLCVWCCQALDAVGDAV